MDDFRHAKIILCALLASALLAACGGAGGGDAAPGVVPGPPPPGSTPPPAPEQPDGVAPTPFADASTILSGVTALSIPTDGRAVVEFFVTDERGIAIDDLGAGDVRFALAKFVSGPLGARQGDWQSYVNRIEAPGVGIGTEPRLQATAERATAGELEPLGDGAYRYRFALDVTDLPADVLAQAAVEGLDLAYDPALTHRVALQFGGGKQANPYLDVQPGTGATDGIPRGLVTTATNCNGCHDRLAIHGGGRVEIEYCVTCHNPGSTDANSTNTMDMEVMTHRIHYAVDLPSVRAGGVYQIYGFRDSLHDYSDVVYPGDVRNCTQCHAGAATDVGLTETLLPDGDNWSEYPTRAGCGSCHDDLDFAAHFGGQPDDGDCRSCHALGGIAGSVAANHVDPVRVAAGRYRFEILDVTATARGEFPVIDFRIVDPTNGDAPWDILADAPFVQPMGASRIAITLGWSTTDYTNHGNGDDLASTVSIDALTSATANGDGSFRVTSPVAIPDGTLAPFIATTGSGTVTIEGHPAETIDGAVERIPVTNVHRYFSVNEPSGEAFPRREIASIEQCNVCHASLSIHGDNRTDDLQACATCHNPRNTDRDVRAIALTPPTDGKAEESIDFKTMIHAIHASAERENPLQLVGFRGFTTYVYDTEHVQYPGFLENCTTCHVGDSYRLPLADSVLATSVDTGADLVDPSDDVVVSPATAVCASCHDDAEAVTHMETEGGDFATTQAFVDMGVTVETCAGCHGPGEFVAVDLVHDIEED